MSMTDQLNIKPLSKDTNELDLPQDRRGNRMESVSIRVKSSIKNKVEAISKLSGASESEVFRKVINEEKLNQILAYYKDQLP